MTLQDRLQACEKATDDTFQQMKTLQNRHQQLIGYKQALLDLLNDQQEQEEQQGLTQVTESIAPQSTRSKKNTA